MNTQKLVFVTPLDDREVEVDTVELCAAGEPPHRVAGGLVEAARFVVARYPGYRPLLLSDKAAGSLEADAMVEAFERARRAALAAVPGLALAAPTPTFEGIVWMVVLLFVVAVALWFQFRPSGPRDGE